MADDVPPTETRWPETCCGWCDSHNCEVCPACVVAPPNRIPWWHRTLSGLVLAACTVGFAGVCAAVSWLVLAVFLGGCAVGYPLREDGTADTNDAIIGISTGTANAAGAGLLSLGGLLSGNPAIVGLAALVAHQFGARKGWDEAEADRLKQRGIVATTGDTA